MYKQIRNGSVDSGVSGDGRRVGILQTGLQPLPLPLFTHPQFGNLKERCRTRSQPGYHQVTDHDVRQ
ncbi:hypothetical protein [Spirosoma koreense]